MSPQTSPCERNGFDIAPFVQTSLVQGLPSTGLSLSSTIGVMRPPMQTFLWQLPTGVLSTSVPSSVLVEPQRPAVQLNFLHAVSVPQSVLTRHWTHAGAVALPLHLVPLL